MDVAKHLVKLIVLNGGLSQTELNVRLEGGAHWSGMPPQYPPTLLRKTTQCMQIEIFVELLVRCI